jgi:MoaA/NifB/PqqE/SkfB family radical SAM enzyme
MPCYRFLHDGQEIVQGKEMELHARSFGSLLEDSLEDIWNGRDYIWFRYTVENALYPSCVDCTLREGCEYLRDSDGNCWGSSPSCGNCLWSRKIIMCP